MLDKPNMLFIFTDEQAINTMKTYGNEQISTPNLDKLADSSFVFEKAYVTQPVCTPSRSTLMTGLYPHNNGCIANNIPLTEDIKCFPEIGNFKHYNTAYYGKWHLGNEIFAQHGFEEWRSIEDTYREQYSDDKDMNIHSDYYHFLKGNGFEPDKEQEDGFKCFSRNFSARLPEEYSKPAYLAREATEFLEQNKDNPFILFVNFLEPHMPYFGPRDNQYDPEDVTLPSNFYDEKIEERAAKNKYLQKMYEKFGHSGLELKTEKDWKKLISNYWGLVSLIDTYIGKILDSLEKNGLEENTIVVFTSDHGDMLGSHKLLAKGVMFEEAIKVPLLLKFPKIKKPKRITAPVSQVDLVPTLLEAMGQEAPDCLEGYSWYDYLLEKGELKEEDVFIEWHGIDYGGKGKQILETGDKDHIQKIFSDKIRTVITPEGWKLNYSLQGDHELYNLTEDPYELNNLAGKNYSNKIEGLTEKIKDWQQRTNDKIINN